jgi:hypothetical protein
VKWILMDEFDIVEWTSTHLWLVKDVDWMELKSIDKCCQQWKHIDESKGEITIE